MLILNNDAIDENDRPFWNLEFSQCLPNQIADLLSVVGAAVGHGQQNALNF